MKYKFQTSLLLAILFFSACKKEFLETKPTTSVDAGSAITTVENAKASLNGIHRSMFMRYFDQGTFGQGTIMLNADVLGEDYVFSGQSNGWFLTAYRWIDHRNVNGGTSFPYTFYFRIISNANVIINGIEKTEGLPADKNNILGQALTYRAFAYFNLVQLYGKRFVKGAANDNLGVPLVLSNTTEPQARATVAEVYAQVNKDLAAAANVLTNTRPDKSNLNLSVVLGLQARVALTQQDWATAATKAAAARAGYTLMSTAAQFADGSSTWTNPEWMWGSSQIDDQTEYFTAYLAYISYNFNSTNIRTNPKLISRSLYNTMATNDLRRALWVVTPTAANSITPPGGSRVAYMNQKFKAKSDANSVGDIPYMRAAEMFLIEAEALARNNNESGSKTVFTTFMKTRVPTYTTSTSTGDAYITEIMDSRRVELWGEGFRFFDLKRLNLSLNRNGSNHNTALAVAMTVPAGDNTWQWLIPQAEINANPLIKQND
jgi:hypothetical protein